MKLLLATGAALLLLGCDLHPNRSEHVELILNPSPPGPATTFELRFDQPMAGPDKIGHSGGAVAAGHQTGLGRRFHLAQPAQRRVFAVRTAGAGPPLRTCPAVRFDGRGWTPVFGHLAPARGNAALLGRVSAKRAEPCGDERGASRHARFQRSRSRRRFGALHRIPRRRGPTPRGGHLAGHKRGRCCGTYRRLDLPANLVSNLVMAASQQPLPVGKGWRLVLRPGLPALEKGLRLRARAEIQLGDVRPFVFEEAIAHHVIEGGASIELRFSKPVAPSLTNNWGRWIQLEPPASNITAKTDGRCLNLRGDFHSGTSYRLVARTGLPAEEAFALDKAATTNILMPAIPARLYFPAFSEDQQAVGWRQFPLRAVNVPSVRLRAKLLEPDAAIYALRGYDSYFRPWPDDGYFGDAGERYRRLDYNLVPGRTVFDQELAGALQRTSPPTSCWTGINFWAGARPGSFLSRPREWARASGPTRVWAHSPSSN